MAFKWKKLFSDMRIGEMKAGAIKLRASITEHECGINRFSYQLSTVTRSAGEDNIEKIAEGFAGSTQQAKQRLEELAQTQLT